MKLIKVNKHVMQDVHGTEYYQDEKGNWKPGTYRNGTFYWLRTRKFYARQRPYIMSDGKQYYFRLTRYTYKRSSHPAYAPLGKNGKQYKRARLETIKEVYYRDGLFYVACNIELNGKLHNSMKPYSGYLFNANPEQSERAGIADVAIWVNDGKPYAIEMDGERTDIAPGEWQEVADWLKIKDVEPGKDAELQQPEQPTNTHEQIEDTSIVEAAAEIVEAEAARVAWIESTTNAGDQLDLIQFFGYGDASWQELAAPAA